MPPLPLLSELDAADNAELETVDLAAFASLRIVRLSGCGLRSIRAGALPVSVRVLDVAGNRLEAVDVGQLVNLRALYVQNNRLGEFPAVPALCGE